MEIPLVLEGLRIFFFLSGLKDDKVKIITVDSMTGAVVNNNYSDLVGRDSSSDSVDGTVPTELLNTNLNNIESLQAALSSLEGVGKQNVLVSVPASGGMLSTQSAILTTKSHIPSVSNEISLVPNNAVSQSGNQIENSRNGGENVLKRPISANAPSPIVNKVIITNDPSTSQPQVIPVGPTSGQTVSVSQLVPGVNILPQSHSPRTPTKTITISQQGILSPTKGIRMAHVVNSPTRVPINRLSASPAKTPTKITMIPVTGRSPLKIAPATASIPVINNSAANSTIPLQNTITMSPSKMIKQGGTVHIVSIYGPWHEISNNVVCATSKGSDQPAHRRRLIRAFAGRLNIL